MLFFCFGKLLWFNILNNYLSRTAKVSLRYFIVNLLWKISTVSYISDMSHVEEDGSTTTPPVANHTAAAAQTAVGKVPKLLSSELSLSLLWTSPVDAASFSLRTIYTPPVTTPIVSSALLTAGETHNASVSHCSLDSASETLITTMAPVWVTFWRGRLVVGLPICLSLSKQVIIDVFLPRLSHFYGLWADRTDSPLLRAASWPSTPLLPWSFRSVLPLNPTPLPQHNTQAITWPRHGGGITHLMCLRCDHNQVTQHRFLSFFW